MTRLRLNCRFGIPARRPARGQRAHAFSLVELVVSIGVLVLLLGMASQVMNLTVRATGQATALTSVNQQLRMLEQTLRDDLKNVDPRRSVMVIVGHPINAYWTQDGAEADSDSDPLNGYPHGADPERRDPFVADKLERPRADVLMLFTLREGTSNVHPQVRGSLQQVVYGHALLGEYTPEGVFTDVDELEPYPLDENTFFSIPADQWVLARRPVLFSPTDPATPLVDPMPTTLDDVRILRGETDVIENFVYETKVLLPSGASGGGFPQYLPEIFEPDGSELVVPYARSQVDPVPPPALAHATNQLFLSRCATFKVEWALDPDSVFVGGGLYGENQIQWIDMGALGDPNAGGDAEPLASIMHARDEAVEQAAAGGSDARANRLFDLLNQVRGSGEEPYSLLERFQQVPSVWIDESPWIEHGSDPRPNVAIFTAAVVDSTGNLVPDDIFPKMLRITVDLYDTNRRLGKPIRHVMVLPVGA